MSKQQKNKTSNKSNTSKKHIKKTDPTMSVFQFSEEQ